MRKFFPAAALAACVGVLFSAHGAERDVDLELVLAADVSRSMDEAEAMLQRQGFVAALLDPDIIAAIQSGPLGRIAVTYVEWAGYGSQRTRVGWAEISDGDSAARFAAAVARADMMLMQFTSISGVITYGAQSFVNNGFRGTRRIIDISGDGPNNSGLYVNMARDHAVDQGIVINGLPILSGRPNISGYPTLPDLDLYYANCVIGGPGAFIVVAHGFDDFARAIRRKMLSEVAGRAPVQGSLQLVAQGAPPCDAGEIQLEEWLREMEWGSPLNYELDRSQPRRPNTHQLAQ